MFCPKTKNGREKKMKKFKSKNHNVYIRSKIPMNAIDEIVIDDHEVIITFNDDKQKRFKEY